MKRQSPEAQPIHYFGSSHGLQMNILKMLHPSGDGYERVIINLWV